MNLAELELNSGSLALDFVNTVEDRLEAEPKDFLGSAADLAEWGRKAGVLSGSGRSKPGGGTAELRKAVGLRGHLASLLDAVLDGRRPRRGDLDALAAAEAQAVGAASLEQGSDGRLHRHLDPTAPASVRHAVALSAGELLSGPDAERIGRCAGPGCGWFFLDTTKRGNRRWCSMAECGQEAKSANRRAARRGA